MDLPFQKVVDKYWYIPSDVIVRGYEALLWSKINIKKPILEIGIGSGNYSFLYSKVKTIDIGIDINNDNIREAKLNKFYNKVITCDARKLPFKNNYFYSVVSNSTLEHINHDGEAIREISRVLRRGGKFIFTVPNKYFKECLLSFISIKNFNKLNIRLDHKTYRDKNCWNKLLLKYNLKMVHCQEYITCKKLKYWYYSYRIFTKKIGSSELWSRILSSRMLGKLIEFNFKKLLALLKPSINDKNKSGSFYMIESIKK